METLWPDHEPTPLLELPALARMAGVARVLLKDEGCRPLGNFKTLGGMTAGLRALARARAAHIDSVGGAVTPYRLLCASDGNHGLAVAAAAARAGAEAWVFLPTHVSPERADRIIEAGGHVIRVSGSYDAAVIAANDAAQRGEGLLIPDTSQHKHDPVVADVMSGYSQITHELRSQLARELANPTHVVVQAGVGGLAAAIAEGLTAIASPGLRVIVAEPASAACVTAGVRAGRPVQITGDLATCADMLACGLASACALEVLLKHEVSCIQLDERALEHAPTALVSAGGPPTTPSGAAGLAGLLHIATDKTLRAQHALTSSSCVMLLITERGTAG